MFNTVIYAQYESCQFSNDCQSFTTIGSDGQTTYLSNLSVPDNELENACWKIHGTLIIDKIYGFTDCDFELAEAANIEIHDLCEINGCTFQAAENKAWRSIKVTSEGRFILQNACVSDAVIGVEVHKDARLHIASSYFDKNYYHVLGYPEEESETIETVNYNFPGNTFDCSGLLIDLYSDPPYDISESSYTIAGMKFYSSDVTIVNEFWSNGSHFINLNNGIIGINCRLTVRQNTFENIASEGIVPIPSGYGVKNEGEREHMSMIDLVGHGQSLTNYTFKNVEYPIYADQSDVFVEDCGLKDAYVGIQILGSISRDIDISNNVLDVSKGGIRMYENDPAIYVDIINNQIDLNDGVGKAIAIHILENEHGHFDAEIDDSDINLISANDGIRLDGAYEYELEQNDIEFTSDRGSAGIRLRNSDKTYFYSNDITGNTTSPNDPQIGIRSKSSMHNEYECNNTTDNLGRGTAFYLDNLGTQLEHMQYKGSHVGLYCEEGSKISDQYHNHNKWDGNFVYKKGVHEGPPSAIEDSELKISNQDDGTSYDPRPSVVPGNDQWVMTVNEDASGSCLEEDEPEQDVEIGPMLGSDTIISTNNLADTNYQEGWEWISRRYLYERLMWDTSYESKHSSFTNFLQSAEADTISTYVDQREELSDILLMPGSSRSVIASYEVDYYEYRDSLIALDSIHLQDSVITDNELDERQEVLDSMQEELDGMDSLRKDWFESVKTDLQSWIANWNNNYRPNTLAENEQDVVSLYVDRLTGSKLNASDSSNLVQIVQQCPLEGGSAVYFARRLLETAFDTVYQVGVCSDTDAKLSKNRPIGSIYVYPNPTENVLHIDGVEIGKRAFIINRLGRKVDEFEITEDPMTYRVGDLKPGIYWIRTKTNSAQFILIRE